MFKGFRQIALLTVISRILGMVRDMTFAFFFGAGGLMDSWVIAFMIPNLARRLFGEGAASSSLIPVYTEELHKDPAAAARLARTVISVVFVVLAGMVILGEVVIWAWLSFFSKLDSTELVLSLTAVMLPYMIIICVVAIVGGVLNSHRHFAAPAFAPVVLNVFIIASLFFGGWVLSLRPQGQLFFVAVAVLVAGSVQLLIQLVPLKASGVALKPGWEVRSEAFKKIVFLMGPMIIGLTATQINTLSDILIGRGFSGSEDKGAEFLFFGKEILYPMWDGAVSRLFYAQRLYQFPLGVFGISLATAIFPVMSADAARKDIASLCQTIARGIKGAVFVALPATLGLILVRKELIAILFERGRFSPEDTILTAAVLAFYSAGLCGFFMQQLAARAFYSLKDSKVPTRSAIVAVIVNVILNLVLIWPLGAAGLALSTAVCSYIQVAILLGSLERRLGKGIFDRFQEEMLKIVFAAAVMFCAGYASLRLAADLPSIVRLAICVIVSAGVYMIAAKSIRIESLSLLHKRK